MSTTNLITGHWPAVTGDVTDVHTVQAQPFGTIVQGLDAIGGVCLYMYMPGVTSGAAGSVVTYDVYGGGTAASALLAGNAKGPVGVMKAALSASTYFGWLAITGTHLALTAAGTAVNTLCGRETTDGYVGDGRAAGDEIYNWVCRQAVTTPAGLAYHTFWYPQVTDNNGS